jgi:hypothetical protein
VITLKRFRRIEEALHDAGYTYDTAWAEQLAPPANADAFAEAAVYVIVNSGMQYRVAQAIFGRCMEALWARGSARRAFGHPGKAKAIDRIWKERKQLFEAYRVAGDKLEFCQSLPWIGPVTSCHLAKEFGVDVAKPDVHLVRLAARDKTTVERLCKRLAKQTGYRSATVDTLLWRACATGILDSKLYEAQGWRAAFRGKPKIQH